MLCLTVQPGLLLLCQALLLCGAQACVAGGAREVRVEVGIDRSAMVSASGGFVRLLGQRTLSLLLLFLALQLESEFAITATTIACSACECARARSQGPRCQVSQVVRGCEGVLGRRCRWYKSVINRV